MLRSFRIDDLEILDTEDFVIEKAGIDGLDEPERRVTTTINPGADGGFIPSTLYGMRAVSISGAVKGKGTLGTAAARLALNNACRLGRDYRLGSVLRTFTFTLDDGRELYFNGQVTRYKSPNMGVGLMDFHISIVAPDPLLYDTADSTSGNILVPSGGGVIVPMLVPFLSASSTGGSATLTNTGNERTDPVLTLVGPLSTGSYIRNVTTGLFMQLNRAVPLGSTVTIDMHNNTMLLNGGGGLLEDKGDGSDFWGLEPGPNQISFQTSSNNDTGYLAISWHNASISV